MKVRHLLFLLRCCCGLVAIALLLVRMAGEDSLSLVAVLAPVVLLGAFVLLRDAFMLCEMTWIFGRMLVARHDAQARKGTTYRRHRK